jgi:hypothetical protein
MSLSVLHVDVANNGCMFTIDKLNEKFTEEPE